MHAGGVEPPLTAVKVSRHVDAQALATHAAGLLVLGAAFAVARGEAAGQGSALIGGSGARWGSWASSVLVSSCWAAETYLGNRTWHSGAVNWRRRRSCVCGSMSTCRPASWPKRRSANLRAECEALARRWGSLSVGALAVVAILKSGPCRTPLSRRRCCGHVRCQRVHAMKRGGGTSRGAWRTGAR